MKGEVGNLVWKTTFDSLKWKCYSCEVCCKYFSVFLTTQDAYRLRSQGLGDKVGRTVDGRDFVVKPEWGECSFLQNRLCKIYKNRPDCCAQYPFIMNIAADGTLRISATRTCPYLGKGKNLTGSYFSGLAEQSMRNTPDFEKSVFWWKSLYGKTWASKFPEYPDLDSMEDHAARQVQKSGKEPLEMYNRINGSLMLSDPNSGFTSLIDKRYLYWLNRDLAIQYVYLEKVSKNRFRANGISLDNNTLFDITIPSAQIQSMKEHVIETIRDGYISQITLFEPRSKRRSPAIIYAGQAAMQYMALQNLSRLIAFASQRDRVNESDCKNAFFGYDFTFRNLIKRWDPLRKNPMSTLISRIYLPRI
jgi:Fe-S-cluster containining protein